MENRLLFLLFLACIVTCVVAYPQTKCGSEASHDLFLGRRLPGDKLLFSAHVTMSSSFLRVKSTDVIWPPKDQHFYESITRVEVYDQQTDGSGGCAFLMEGGVGNNYLRLHLKTQRGGKFDFFIKVFGR
ncbi:probable salivary secreted peptide isoform X1 [Rhodnius prolixus]|uniref:probable salivary secreted peptide isoform X1 n=1 Tax=Rhodnius prolixus TaxID=13249 RepID=UPI003D187831